MSSIACVRLNVPRYLIFISRHTMGNATAVTPPKAHPPPPAQKSNLPSNYILPKAVNQLRRATVENTAKLGFAGDAVWIRHIARSCRTAV